MKKILSRFCTFAAAAVVAASFTACSSEEGEVYSTSKGAGKAGLTYNMKLNVSKGDEGTRALRFNGTTLEAGWKTTESFYVYDASWNLYSGTLSPTEESYDHAVEVSGNITTTGSTATPAVGNTVNFVFPRTTWSYEGQDGTLETIASTYDYALGSAVIDALDGNTIITATTPGDVVFESQQAILKINFLNGADNPLSVKTLTIHDSMGNLVQSVSSFNNGTETKGDLTVSLGNAGLTSCYVALRGVKGGSTLTFKATDTNDNVSVYNYTLKNTALENGKYYEIDFKPEDALTVEAQSDNTVVKFTNNAANPVSAHVYDSNGSLKTSVGTDGIVTCEARQETTITTLSAGEKVLFFGDNTTYTSYTGEGTTANDVNHSHITVEAAGLETIQPAYVYGNVMSLINGTDWAKDDNSALPSGNATFAGLFRNEGSSYSSANNTKITSHPTKNIILPATTLQDGCYQRMFFGTDITRAPELPATTLQEYCYSYMFNQTDITASPVLPAEQLVKGCYNSMFNGCTSLTSITCLAKSLPTELAFNDCTANWTSGVPMTTAGCGTFYVNNTIEPQLIAAADYFSKNPTAQEYHYAAPNGGGMSLVPKTGFWADAGTSNPFFFWSSGTGGIPNNWNVQAAR